MGEGRRRVLGLLGGAVAAGAGLGVWGTSFAAPHRVGFLCSRDALTLKRFRESVLDGIAARGYRPGTQLELLERYAEGQAEKLPGLVQELLALKPDLIITQGTPAALAVKRATASVPVLVISAGDLAAAGLVESHGRPGGNVTGLTIAGTEATLSQLELLREIAPRVKRIGLMGNKGYADDQAAFAQLERALRGSDAAARFIETSAASDYNGVFRALLRDQVEGLLVMPSNIDNRDWPNVMRLATSRKVPAVYAFGESVAAGGLACCEVNRHEFFRSAGQYVERILQGARPAELPVLQPTKFDITLNAAAADKLGLQITPALRSRATRVVE